MDINEEKLRNERKYGRVHVQDCEGIQEVLDVNEEKLRNERKYGRVEQDCEGKQEVLDINEEKLRNIKKEGIKKEIRMWDSRRFKEEK